MMKKHDSKTDTHGEFLDPLPRHREASYGGDYVKLENHHLCLILYRRQSHLAREDSVPPGTPYQPGGWAWGELFGPLEENGARQYLGILEHFGEIDLVGHRHPLRLEAESYQCEHRDGVQTIHFNLLMQLPEEPCMVWGNMNAVRGSILLSLGDDDRQMRYQLTVHPTFHLRYRYLRGPWLRIGAYDTACVRTDAIFPGLEWLKEREWSSGSEYHAPSNALRVAPHPYKVQIPLMTVSRNGLAVSLCWNAMQRNVDTLSRMREPQPVFASPNFIDRRDEHILGLMLPTAVSGMAENALEANPPIDMPATLQLSAEISIDPGTSLDAVVAWVKRHGMPNPGPPRWEWHEAIERIARAYNTHYWKEDIGWTYGPEPLLPWVIVNSFPALLRRQPYMYMRFIDWYIEQGPDRSLAGKLAKKAAWCRRQGAPGAPAKPGGKIDGSYEMLRWYSEEELRGLGDEILQCRQANGDFTFDPAGRHKREHLQMAGRWKPLGMPGDSVLDLCMTPALLLILLGDHLGDDGYLAAARTTLDYAQRWDRPEGADWWETPLHSPALLTAGWAMLAYGLGARIFQEERYSLRARHFLRCLLPFTYLWEPEGKHLLYQTKPLFGTTGWHYMAWTDRCVQWHILMLNDISAQVGLDWATLDPELDWATYRRGVMTAGLRWLVDSHDARWMERCEDHQPDVLHGMLDMALADVHDPVDDMYGGLGFALEPASLAAGITDLLV